MRKKNIYRVVSVYTSLFVAVVQALFYTSCATYSSAPGGGPMDLEPPKLISAAPKNAATFFSNNLIVMNFDEFVELKDLDKIYTTPYLSQNYYTHSLKQVKVELRDTLMPDMTYTIRFNNSIVDLHEANQIKDFSYVFSTGANIDSMYIQGNVYQAEDLKPVEGASILFYNSQQDSFPLEKKPDYVAVTDKSGFFYCKHMKDACYYLYATTDENKNFILDPIDEKMAYSDSCYKAWKQPIYIAPDTTELFSIDTVDKRMERISVIDPNTGMMTMQDSVYYILDTIANVDTVGSTQNKNIDDLSINMFLYKDFIPCVFLKELKYTKKGMLSANFMYPIENIERLDVVLPIDSIYDDIPYLKVIKWADDRKSADIYLQKYDIAEASVIFGVNSCLDTSDIYMTEVAFARSDSTAFKLSSNAKSLFYIFDTIAVTANMPIVEIDTSRLEFWNIVSRKTNNDTVTLIDTIRQDFEIFDFDHWGFKIKSELKEGGVYALFMRDSSVFDFWDRTNDTLLFRLSCGYLEDRGDLAVRVKGLEANETYKLCLLDQNGKTIRMSKVVDTTTIEFKHLLPGMYSLMLFNDKDNDGEWDEGRYVHRKQPERRWFNNKKLRVEADWRIEENWEINF